MAQQAAELASKPHELSVIPRIHVVEAELLELSSDGCAPACTLHACYSMHVLPPPTSKQTGARDGGMKEEELKGEWFFQQQLGGRERWDGVDVELPLSFVE